MEGEGGKCSLLRCRCRWLCRGGGIFGGLGGVGGDGSGRSRWDDRNLLSIIHAHLFLFNASLNQYVRDPNWSMKIVSGIFLPFLSIHSSPSSSVRHLVGDS